jgi:hypothetical protein
MNKTITFFKSIILLLLLIFNCFEALSANEVSIFNGIESPNAIEVGINSQNQNVITWNDTTDLPYSYQIYRTDFNQSRPWVRIGQVYYGDPFTFVDHSANTEDSIYSYAISACDECGDTSTLSKVIKTLALSGYSDEFSYTKLSWHYNSNKKLRFVRIFRGLDIQNLTEIAFLSDDENQYIDVPEELGMYYYRVELLTDKLKSAENTTQNLQYFSNVISVNVENIPASLIKNYVNMKYNFGKDKILVTFPNDSNDVFQMKLFDSLGHLVEERQLNDRVFEISTINRSKGVYFFQLQSSKKNYTQKILFF